MQVEFELPAGKQKIIRINGKAIADNIRERKLDPIVHISLGADPDQLDGHRFVATTGTAPYLWLVYDETSPINGYVVVRLASPGPLFLSSRQHVHFGEYLRPDPGTEATVHVNRSVLQATPAQPALVVLATVGGQAVMQEAFRVDYLDESEGINLASLIWRPDSPRKDGTRLWLQTRTKVLLERWEARPEDWNQKHFFVQSVNFGGGIAS